MKKFHFLSRLVAVLLTAMTALPLWADGNPSPNEYWRAYQGYTEETPVALSASLPIGTQFSMTDQFPVLKGRQFMFIYDWNAQNKNIPGSDNEGVCVIEVSEPMQEQYYDEDYDSFYSVTLGDGYCISSGVVHMTVWAFESEWDAANLRDVFTKKYTYNITITVTNELLPGYDVNYNEAQESDPSALHDIKMYVGETRENWIGFFACQATYSPADDTYPASFDVDCGQAYDDNTHSRFPTLTSGDESVVSIGSESYGMPNLTAVAPGVAVITIQSPDAGEYYTAVSKTFTVTVLDGEQQHPGEGGLHFSNLNRHDPDFPLFRAYTGHDFALPTLVNETGLPNSELQFESTNPDVATIDENGVITLTGEFGETWISVEQKYYPKYHSDIFNLSVTDPFSVKGISVSPSQYDDILNDGGSLKYIPETHTFVMNNMHVDYLNGGQVTEDNYGDIHDDASIMQSTPTAFINWSMPDDVNIYLTGSNEILNANRIVLTDTTICHNVTFTGHGSLYAKIYYSSFVNGVYTNAFVQGYNDYREVTAEGDTVTNITIDGASVVIDRDVTFDIHYPNIYSQIISVDKLKVINNGYIRAKFVGDEFGVKNVAKAVITLKEFENDATTDLFYYLDWVDDYGYNHGQPEGQMYRSKSFLSYSRTAIVFEAGPTIDVAESDYSYDLTYQNPTTSSYIGFKNSAAAEFSYGAGIVMFRGYTDTEIEKGLKTIAPKTDIWNEVFPGVVALYMSRGSGTINLRSLINEGYSLKVMIVDGDKIITRSFAGTGTEEDYAVHYCLENSAYAAIYMQTSTPAAPVAAHRAPQKNMDVPGLYLKRIGAEPDYVGPMETLVAMQDPDNSERFYATFFNSTQNYRLADDGTEAYYATVNGDGNLQMTLVGKDKNVILKNHAVILKAASATVGLVPELDVPTYPVMSEATTASNDLVGTDEAVAAPANSYVLNDHSADNSVNSIGLYAFSGTLQPNTAYVIYTGAAGAQHCMSFIFPADQTPTATEDIHHADNSIRKVIENGQLYIIKNSVRYNAQGQLIAE